MAPSLEQRRDTYRRLSAQLGAMDSHLLEAEGASLGPRSCWGQTQSLDLGGEKVFVKRVPVTLLEYENLLSTQNLYELPNCFNYGIGSFGRSVFRELQDNLKCTDWVLSGEWPFFPLTYHYRVVPHSTAEAPKDQAGAEEFVAFWGGNAKIARYEADRRHAPYELVIYQEYFPHVLESWLRQNVSKTGASLQALFETIEFLKTKGIVHFDAHFQNVVTDGKHPYLTDFGLAMDEDFLLSEEEKLFLGRHRDYDYARLISCLAFLVDDRYQNLPEPSRLVLKERFGLAKDATTRQVVRVLVSQIEQLADELNLDRDYASLLARYGECYELMHSFSAALIRDENKEISFPCDEFRLLLSRAGH